jgi:hypothetical protein
MPDSSSTSDLVLRWVVALLASGVVFMLQFHFFQSRPTKNNPNSPASFLNLSDIMSGKRLRNLARLYAVPFAALFFLLATRSEAFVTAAKNSLNVYLSGLSGEQAPRSPRASAARGGA